MRMRTVSPARAGVAAAELAAVAPLLALLAAGMIEVTRVVQVKHYLTDTARSACRLAILPGSSTASVTANIQQTLAANGIDAADVTPTILVNGSPADVNTAKAGDQISVQVSVPVARVNWITPVIFTSQ